MYTEAAASLCKDLSCFDLIEFKTFRWHKEEHLTFCDGPELCIAVAKFCFKVGNLQLSNFV